MSRALLIVLTAGLVPLTAAAQDRDGDRVPDDIDNCPDVPNSDQQDSCVDALGAGDACAPDTDEDGVLDGCDNCENVLNPEQEDSCTEDDLGDACDADQDDDDVPDACDNCPDLSNPDQTDLDENGVGGACEPREEGWCFKNCATAPPRGGRGVLGIPLLVAVVVVRHRGRGQRRSGC